MGFETNSAYLVCAICCPPEEKEFDSWASVEAPPSSEAPFMPIALHIADFSGGWGACGLRYGDTSDVGERIQKFFDNHSHMEHPDYNERASLCNFYIRYEVTPEQQKEEDKKLLADLEIERRRLKAIPSYLLAPKVELSEEEIEEIYKEVGLDKDNQARTKKGQESKGK